MLPILALDDRARADLVLLLDRAAVFGDGTVRLVADGPVALLTTPMTASSGLLDSGPTVLIARAARMRDAAAFDGVVALPALRDALREGADIEVPEGVGRPAWAAVSPPRGGWELAGEVPVDEVRRLAAQAAEDVEAMLPRSPGEAVRRRAERSVWARAVHASGLTAGQAAALVAMRFLGEEPVRVTASGGWVRASGRAGEALAR
ncbi:hypothetical protein [Agrococcus terreus]|uniref:DUF8185 domain-containing protein n=1 Tax=Agrococcus terreus TaxID=574649 RepID=A0ABQ2KGJ5_9MICO|nr:hypothetical protein [Agrococcus terreus]GGN82712.1 hypothetical protein GCM10010968_12780 [Agrococcus terreus]